jgi:hypothetical protein
MGRKERAVPVLASPSPGPFLLNAMDHLYFRFSLVWFALLLAALDVLFA